MLALLIGIILYANLVLIDTPARYREDTTKVAIVSEDPITLRVRGSHIDSITAISKVGVERRGEVWHVDVRVSKLRFMDPVSRMEPFDITFSIPDGVNVVTYGEDRYVIWERHPKDESEMDPEATN